jgi:hypothetical protein
MEQSLTTREIHSTGMIDPAAMAAAETAKQIIQAAFTMAAQRPRNVDQARINILQACKRPAFAARAEYRKPVGGKIMRGPSIRFAETAIRIWGNVRSDVSVVFEDLTVRRIRVSVVDLETNSGYSKEISLSKTVERRDDKGREVVGKRVNTNGQVVYIVLATDDELANKESAAISKVIRNDGLRLLPSDITDEGMDEARLTTSNADGADPRAAKKRMMDAFAEIGVMPLDLEKYLGHNTEQIVPAELDDLRGMYQAIRDGEARWADFVAIRTPTEANEKKATETVVMTAYAAKTETAKPEETKPVTEEQKPQTQPQQEQAQKPRGVTTSALMAAVRKSGLNADLLNEYLAANGSIESGKSFMDSTMEVKSWIVGHPNLSDEVSAWVDARDNSQ